MSMAFVRIAFVGIGLGFLACQKESVSSEAPRAVDSAPKAAALDPALAEAVAAASAGIGPGQALSPANSGGPPPNGIFAPGAADKELLRGQLPKITLGSEGSEPRVTLGSAQPKPGSRRALSFKISTQSAPNQGALPIELSVLLEAQKPRGDEGHVNEVPVVARITAARVGLTGAPRELEDGVARLKGAKVEYLVLPDGAGTGFRFDVPKGAPSDLSDVVRSLSDLLAVITLPYPNKPVGVGALWMATSRDTALGLDVVTYRLVKVEKATPNSVVIGINTKRYAADSNFQIPGLPPDAPRSMQEFQALAEGTLELEPGKDFPVAGRQESALGAALGSPDRPDQRGMFEIRMRAEWSSGDRTPPPAAPGAR